MRFVRLSALILFGVIIVLPRTGAEEIPGPSHEQLNFQGWTVWLNKSLRTDKPEQTARTLQLIDAQLKRVVDVVPPKALVELRTVPIWINPKYENAGARCEYHPSGGWLKRNGRDPKMAKAVEVTNVSDFENENFRMPYLVLHELAHAYHDRVLGFNNAEIKAAFDAAKQSGGYDRVQRFNGRKMVKDKAYAMSSPQEYFAENTEAYFGRNDFYPFDRDELAGHDPRLVPLLRKVWQDEPANKPFVKYSPAVQNYLKRIQSGQSEFSYHAEWPGGFGAWQKAARPALMQRIGLTQIKNDLKRFIATVELDEPQTLDGYSRIRASIQTEPDVSIPFYILIPDGDGPFPLAVCPHGHHARGWHLYAGVYENETDRKETIARSGNVAEQLVRKGFVAIAPATRGLAQETFITDVKNRHGKRNCRAQLMHCLISGRTPIGERVWDLQRILDWACKHVKVDADRIVMLGNSGGGVATAYAAAIDTRIKAAIPSCSFTSVTSSTGYIFHCDCCAVPGILNWGDLSDVGGLIAPRSLMIVHGPEDKLHHRPDVDRNAAHVQKIFQAANAESSLEQAWGDSGHQFYPKLMWKFIDEHLPAD